MANIRRWYIYIVCTVSLQVAAWSLVSLLKSIILGDFDKKATASGIALCLVGFIVFLIHWLWARRLASGSDEERGALVRRLYLVTNMSVFLLAVIFTFIDLIAGLLGELFASHFEGFRLLSYGEVLLVPLATILVSGLLWFYHNRIKIEESAAIMKSGSW